MSMIILLMMAGFKNRANMFRPIKMAEYCFDCLLLR